METQKLCCLLMLLVLGLARCSSAADLCNAADKKTLLAIKASFGNPYLLASWKSDTDCCGWYQVDCDSSSGRIISLTIFSGNLSGQLPSTIGDLPYLQTLEFRKLTDVYGPIPSSIAKLTNLKQLRLSYLNLTGTIPDFIGSLTNLNLIELSYNALTGTIPSSLSNLHQANAINLDHNQLTGSIPSSFGSFSGTIPELDLSHNQLTGPIPSSLGSVDFTNLDFSYNKLTGDPSFLFGKSKGLQLIDLSHNKLQFNLTSEVFPTGLTNLVVGHNKIFGSIPSSLTTLTGLQELDVSYNNLCGQIPQGGKLQSFDQTSYSNNTCLCGSPLPACTS